tara:strand:- start:7111 stop:7335 length:225 start_codon:yes stop_codon:yes gene_type:complete
MIDELELKRQYRRNYYAKNKEKIQRYQKKYYKDKREEFTEIKNDYVRPYSIHDWKGERSQNIKKNTGKFIIDFN